MLDALTPREREILNLMIADLSNAEIAERLVMTLGTVRWYVSEIYSKLDVHSRDEAIARAADLNPASQSVPAPSTPTNLPARPTSLVGREREIAAVRLLILREDVRLLTLVGTPGIGKTRLSLETAATLLNEFPHGVYFVSLAPLSDPALVAAAIGGALGIQEMGGQSIPDLLIHYLREKSLLLVLDNFEHLLPAAPLMADLLAAAPYLKVLATSREVLRLYGEQEYPVPPLALPDPKDNDDLDTLAEYEAVALFVRRAQAVKPDFELTSENVDAVADICTRLDGLPLAIELAAARAKLHSPNALLERLNKRLSVLTGGARDLPERHQTLRGAIAWSYDLLDDGEQRLFARLGVFVGGWSVEAIEAVCLGASHDSPLQIDVFDGLESLLNKSLVQQTESVLGAPRFTMLETLHEYALEKLAESGEEEATQRAHAEYFLALAERAEPELYRADQQYWLNQLEEDYSNLRAGLQWLADVDVEAAARFASSLAYFWWIKGSNHERRFWLESLVKKRDVFSLASQARVLREVGKVTRDQGELSLAQTQLQESLVLYKQLEDGQGIGLTLWDLGWLAEEQYDFNTAHSRLEESILILQEHGNKNELASSINELANLFKSEGDYKRAQTLYEESLALRREFGNLRGVASSLSNLGTLATDLGDLSHAEALLQESLSISRHLGARLYVAVMLERLARIMRHRREWVKSAALSEESMGLFREIDLKRGEASIMIGLAHAKMQLGECEYAHLLLQQSLSLYRHLQDPYGFIDVLLGFAQLAAVQKQWRRAVCLFGAVDAQREQNRIPLPPSERVLLNREIFTIRTHLHEEAIATAWAEGELMTLEEAVVYALEEP